MHAAARWLSPLGMLAVGACRRLKRGPDGASGPLRTVWDGVQTSLLLLSTILIPLRIAWNDVLFASPALLWDSVELTVDILLAADIAVWLCTPYYKLEKTVLVSSPREIAAHYARTKLLFDVICAFPFNLVLSLTNSQHGLWQLLRVVQALRLAKVMRTSASLRTLRVYKLFVLQLGSKAFVQIGWLVCILLVVIHTLACTYCACMHVPAHAPCGLWHAHAARRLLSSTHHTAIINAVVGLPPRSTRRAV